MKIYVDELHDYGKDGKWCHMWTDGDDSELDAFADQIGLSRRYAQTSNGISGRFYHYDLRPGLRVVALKQGAEAMRLRDYIRSKLKP